MQAPNSGFSINPFHILMACRRYAVLVVAFAAISVAALHFALAYLPPVYTAASVVWIDSREARILSSGSAWSAVEDGGISREQERIIASTLVSIPVLRRVVVALDLHENTEAFQSRSSVALEALLRDVGWRGSDVERVRLSDSRVLDETRNEAERQVALWQDASLPQQARPVSQAISVPSVIDSAVEPAEEEARIQSAVARLADRVELSVNMGSELVTIRVTALEPEFAAAVANEISRAYAAERAARLRSGAGAAVDWLENRVAVLGAEVAASQQEIKLFRERNGVVETGEDGGVTPQIAALEDDLQEARANALALEQRLETAEEALENGSPAVGIFRSEILDELQRQQSEAAAHRARLVSQVGPDHRLVEDINDRIAALQAEIEDERRRLLSDLEPQLRSARALVQRLERRVAEERDEFAVEAQRQSSLKAELDKMERDLAANRALYQDLLGQLKSARQVNELDSSSVRLVQPALEPGGPSGLSPKILLAAGGIGSLAFGFLAVGGLAILDQRIRYSDQVRAFDFDTTTFAPKLDRAQLRAPAIGSGHSESLEQLAFDEAIRRLLSTTGLATGGRAEQVVLVTSGAKGEGKSTVSHALASLSAASGRRTVYVEADLRRPGVHARGARQRQPGLRELLKGTASFDEVAIVEKETGLTVLPTIRTVQQSTELLASPQMEELLARLRREYAFVVVDTPPVSMTPDAEVLAPSADGVVFVLEHARSTIGRTATSLDNLARVCDVRFHAFVNKSNKDFMSQYYGTGDYLYRAVPHKTSRWSLFWNGPGTRRKA